MNILDAVTGDVPWKKTVLKDFKILTGKLQTCNLAEKRFQEGYFPGNVSKLLRTPVL